MIPARAAGAWGCTARPPICSQQMLLFCRGLFVPFPQDCDGNSSPPPQDLRNWCMNPLRCPASMVIPIDSIPIPVDSVPLACWTLKQCGFFSPAKQALNSLFNMVPLLFSGLDKVLMLKGCTCSQLISGYLV